MWTEVGRSATSSKASPTGQTMQVLNSAIASGELNAVVNQVAAAAFSGFEAQAARVTLLAAWPPMAGYWNSWH